MLLQLRGCLAAHNHLVKWTSFISWKKEANLARGQPFLAINCQMDGGNYDGFILLYGLNQQQQRNKNI